jgi:uncharacterized membrane protein YhiD involved in acid resistance
MQDLLSLHTSLAEVGAASTVLAIALSFVLSTLVALTYAKTFQGLSYSKSYLQALILGAVVTTIAMLAVGDSLARGLGMMGALAMIRFRSSLKDPRDMIFIFASLAIGIAAGVHNYGVAVLGSVAFCAVALILYRSPLSHRSHFDGLLRFHMENGAESRLALEQAMNRYCRNFALITLRDVAQGKAVDYAYQVKIRADQNHADFLDSLKAVPTIRGVSLLLQETTVEV